MATIKQVLEKNKDALLKLDGVVAVGIGYKVSEGKKTPEIGIIVSVKKKQPELVLNAAEVIPSSLNGIKTDVIETGEIRITENIDHMRPALGGVSIGHKDITAGTLGCIVKRNGVRYILSNNHVLANSNAAEIGDAILQPGPHDGGTMEHRIAILENFIPITMSEDSGGGLPDIPDLPSECNIAQAIVGYFNATAILFRRKTRLRAVTPVKEGWKKMVKNLADSDNYVDAAIALPLIDADVDDHILEIGQPEGIEEALLDMPLQKSGRTTGYTQDVVLQTDVTVDVQYGEGKVARFVDQFMAGPMSAGGDSGSAILNSENKIVGLLFAGSDDFTIASRIQRVFEALEVEL